MGIPSSNQGCEYRKRNKPWVGGFRRVHLDLEIRAENTFWCSSHYTNQCTFLLFPSNTVETTRKNLPKQLLKTFLFSLPKIQHQCYTCLPHQKPADILRLNSFSFKTRSDNAMQITACKTHLGRKRLASRKEVDLKKQLILPKYQNSGGNNSCLEHKV